MINQEIVDKATTALSNMSLNRAYKKTRAKSNWVIGVMEKGHDEMASNIKLRSDNNEYLSYEKACTIMDQAVLTVSAIYEQYLNEKTT